MTRSRDFAQVDVFTSVPYQGNPVAVVLDADGMTDEEMAAFARWTNLSETTFVLPARETGADYRLRIFTTQGELPFAGHPTLGSAHAWLEAGGRQWGVDIVQECEVGLVRIRRDGSRLAFAASPLRRSGPVDESTSEHVAAALGLDLSDLRDLAWVDNGPGWLGVLLADGDAVRRVTPDYSVMGEHDLKLGVVGLWDAASAQGKAGIAAEVRAFIPGEGAPEDPVTGSLNAGLAQWLVPLGVLPGTYVAGQGWALQRDGRVHVEQDGADIWVGGSAVTCIHGTVEA